MERQLTSNVVVCFSCTPATATTELLCRGPYLSDHLREVVDVSSAQGLRLKAFGLQQVLGHVRGVDEHAMQRSLLVPIRLEHDLKERGHESHSTHTDTSRHTYLHREHSTRYVM